MFETQKTTRRPGAFEIWIVIGCCVAGLVHALDYWNFTVDDAYITFRYARNWHAGHGWSFNPGGEQVEGFSNLLWTLLQVAFLRAGAVDVVLASKLVSLALLVGIIVGAWALALQLDAEHPRLTLIAPAGVALCGNLMNNAMAGLETPLHVLLILLAGISVAGLDRPGRWRPWLLGCAVGLLTFSRPESFGQIGAFLVIGGWLLRRSPLALRRLGWAAGVAVMAHMVLLGWRWQNFHALLPNTVAAKSPGDLRHGGMLGLIYVFHFFAHEKLMLDLAVFLGAAIVLFRRGARRDLLAAIPILACAVFSIASRGDWMLSFRFMMPAVPFIWALLARAAMAVSDCVPQRGWRLAGGALLALMALQDSLIQYVAIGGGALDRGWKSPFWIAGLPKKLTLGFEPRLAPLTRWLIEHGGPGSTAAIGDIGFPSYASATNIIDLVGLTDRRLAKIAHGGDAAAMGDYLRNRNPDWILVRLTHGQPSVDYDRLVVASGVLSSYEIVAHIATYGEGSEGVIYQRRDSTVRTDEAAVRRNYAEAIRWNPRVSALREWRDDYERAKKNTAQ